MDNQKLTEIVNGLINADNVCSVEFFNSVMALRNLFMLGYVIGTPDVPVQLQFLNYIKEKEPEKIEELAKEFNELLTKQHEETEIKEEK